MMSVRVTEQDSWIVLQNRFVRLMIDSGTGKWSGIDSRSGLTMVADAEFRVDKAGHRVWPEPKTAITWRRCQRRSVFGRGLGVELRFEPQQGYEPVRLLQLFLYRDERFVELAWGIENQKSFPMRITDVEVVYAAELFRGQRVNGARTLRSGAGAEPNFVERGWEIEAWNGAMLTYRNGEQRRTIVAGGLAYAEFARRVEILRGRKAVGADGNIRFEQRRLRNLNILCTDPHGKLVPPGERYLCPDTSYLDFVTENPFEALERYGMALRKANDAHPNVYDFPTLCGWMVSTKNLGEGKPINNSPGLVEQTEIARERGLMKYTPLAVRLEPDYYCYGNWGDTQQGWWDDAHWEKYGSLRKPYETFRKFCRAVAERGGIPFTYFQASMPSNDFALCHPDWMLHDDISRLHVNHYHHRPFVRYDYTNPEFQKHVLDVWRRLRRCGLKGVKFDYPETAWAKDGGFDNPSYTTTSAYVELFRLCRRGLGPDAYIHERILGANVHENVPRLDVTAGVVDLQRVWNDSSHFEPEMASRIGLRWYKNRSVFIYYPDGKSFIRDGKALPAYKRQALLTLIGFLGGRLEIGTSIGSMTDAMLHDLTRIFPMFGGTQSPRPVDMLTGKRHPEVYLYTVADGWWQVVLVNNG
ncbi:MAG: hypothetical protein D6820_04810, partial [Lentisphaerae bacterium]